MKKMKKSVVAITMGVSLAAVPLFLPIDQQTGGMINAYAAETWSCDKTDLQSYESVFDPTYYADNNPDVVAAFGSEPELLLLHFIQFGMSEGRQGCDSFDVFYYKTSNPDLQKLFENDLKSYYLHYMFFGKDEGRKAKAVLDDRIASYQAVYDEQYYLAHNQDVAEAYGNDRNMVFLHFLDFGMQEGRQACENFNLMTYMQNNLDVVKAYGTDFPLYYQHYINFGCNEGRNAEKVLNDFSQVFDSEFYATQNADVQETYGNNRLLLLQHFLNYGMNEGRQGAPEFNVSIYKNNYSDLQNAYADDLPLYYLHYLNFGMAEGRNAVTAIGNTDIDNKKDEEEVNLADFKYTTDSGWAYGTDNGHSIYILGYTGTATDLIVPATIEGRDVTYVKISNPYIKNLVLPDTVRKTWLELENVEKIDLGSGMDVLYRDTIRSAPKLKELIIGGHITNIITQWAGTDDTYLPFFHNVKLTINSDPDEIMINGEGRLVDNAEGDIFGIMNWLAGSSKESYFSIINFKSNTYSN